MIVPIYLFIYFCLCFLLGEMCPNIYLLLFPWHLGVKLLCLLTAGTE